MIDTNNLNDHECASQLEIGKKLFADKTGKSSLIFDIQETLFFIYSLLVKMK